MTDEIDINYFHAMERAEDTLLAAQLLYRNALWKQPDIKRPKLSDEHNAAFDAQLVDASYPGAEYAIQQAKYLLAYLLQSDSWQFPDEIDGMGPGIVTVHWQIEAKSVSWLVYPTSQYGWPGCHVRMLKWDYESEKPFAAVAKTYYHVDHVVKAMKEWFQ